MKKFPFNQKIRDFAKVFHDHGYNLYVVGGAVRDFLLGRKNDDYDFTTDATPDEVCSMFRNTILTGMKHGTVTVRFFGESYETTTFRTEGDYLDGRHPSSVTFVRSLEEDLKRRDFTINAFAADTRDGNIIDLHGGCRDLKKKVIRAIGDPMHRFNEDALRILRACRFSSALDFSIEDETFDAMCALSHTILKVSAERIRVEFYKLLMGTNPIAAFRYMDRSEILNLLFPELMACRNVEQLGHHHEDVFHHLFTALSFAVEHDFPLSVRLAVLFHDVGKPQTRDVKEDGSYSFYGHDFYSAKLTRNVLTRLKDSNANIEKVTNLVKNHMFNYTPAWSDGAVRRFINRVGKDSLEELMMVRICDARAMNPNADLSLLFELEDRIEALLKSDDAFTLKDLDVTGNDLMEIGIPKGRKIGIILNLLLEEVLDDPELNRKDILLDKAKAISEGRA